ncbi:MAG: hypothetical protein M1343_00350 [Chloroflexi bacterium]|nr:hypothetical protein [Chloroflexota bacterium]MDA8188738.1 hypothetical protein [Dehalococcoidales bacterium]
MDLTLQPEEVLLLRRILVDYLADLRGEIADTDSYEMRKDLEREEAKIKALIGKLQLRR